VEFYTKAFFVALAALVAYGLLLVLTPFAGSMTWAIFLAFMLYPFHLWMSRKLRGRAGTSAGIITGLTPFALLTPLTLLGVEFVRQARTLMDFVRDKNFQLDENVLLNLEQYPVIGPIARIAREQFSVSAADIQTWLESGTQTIMRIVASVGGGFVLSALGTVMGFFFMLFLLFFFIRDGKSIFDRLQRLIPVPEEHREQLFIHLASVTRGVFYGIGLAGILALLPAGGAAIVWIPAVLYLVAAGQWGMTIFMLIAGVITSTADNFLRPILVSRYAPVSAFMVFVGVVGGIAAFGAIGIVVGPVFLALVAAILEYFDEKVIAPNKRSLDAQADDERPPPMPGL
jgi:predicted PurR-regulated permease PerM